MPKQPKCSAMVCDYTNFTATAYGKVALSYRNMFVGITRPTTLPSLHDAGQPADRGVRRPVASGSARHTSRLRADMEYRHLRVWAIIIVIHACISNLSDFLFDSYSVALIGGAIWIQCGVLRVFAPRRVSANSMAQALHAVLMIYFWPMVPKGKR